MAKPMPMEDEEDALSMVMGAMPTEDEEAGEELAEAAEEPAEEPSAAGALLDEITSKIEQLRGLVASA
jgi:hypothetical protein